MSSAATDLSPLFEPDLSFSSTATRLSKSSTNQFHLLIELHDFLTTSDRADDLAVSARMKAEWCLWEGYSKWNIGLNPFLGHFVEVWEAGNRSPDTVVVGIILSGQASKVVPLLNAYNRSLLI